LEPIVSLDERALTLSCEHLALLGFGLSFTDEREKFLGESLWPRSDIEKQATAMVRIIYHGLAVF